MNPVWGYTTWNEIPMAFSVGLLDGCKNQWNLSDSQASAQIGDKIYSQESDTKI